MYVVCGLPGSLQVGADVKSFHNGDGLGFRTFGNQALTLVRSEIISYIVVRIVIFYQTGQEYNQLTRYRTCKEKQGIQSALDVCIVHIGNM